MNKSDVLATNLSGPGKIVGSNYNFNPGETAKYTMSVAVMLTGVAAHRIRRFEECGLCSPSRTGAGQRLYSDRDIELIKKISELQSEGINLPGVRAILNMSQFGQK